MFANASINPPAGAALHLQEAGQLQNSALEAQNNGDFNTAERLYLEAIALKERHLGFNQVTIALSYNSLGELYLRMKKLDKADVYLTKAHNIRSSNGPPMDAAVTRENLAQLEELRGDLAKAKQIRLSGDKLCCTNDKCPGLLFNLDQLKVCGKCKAAYYCSAGCQKQDWKERHKALCKAA